MNKYQERKGLFDIYDSAMNAVRGDTVVESYLTQASVTGDIYVVAIGKAATAMASGAITRFDCADHCQLTGGILITKDGHLPSKPLVTHMGNSFVMIESAHPIPDQRSLEAGHTLVNILQNLPIGTHLLFLLSGGASSLVELLPETVSLQELQQLNQYLLTSGLAIEVMNELRQQMSLIKGGGLLNYVCARKITALYISDVQGDDINVIGSGLVTEPKQSQLNMAAILSLDNMSLQISSASLRQESSLPPKGDSGLLLKQLPADILALLHQGNEGRNQSIKKVFDQCYTAEQVVRQDSDGKKRVGRVTHKIVACLGEALQAASDFVASQGLALHHCPTLYGELTSSAKIIASTLKAMTPGVMISGGEVTVALPKNPGQGGRNQSIALAVASEIAGCNDIIFMAIGTDGTDGPGTDAGAMVDGETCERGLIQGLEPMDHLRRADAGIFLEATADLISSGPTGTNVMDLYIGIKLP
ncbi:D-glycerate 2-kinase [hydrothermal vent metagenome]|uniref:D-glycerate 2-kinase n=1 Tax=hydrothermal vent metagenome TaxID=652676 RepID=A0A3B0XTF7_9ZZZZ